MHAVSSATTTAVLRLTFAKIEPSSSSCNQSYRLGGKPNETESKALFGELREGALVAVCMLVAGHRRRAHTSGSRVALDAECVVLHLAGVPLAQTNSYPCALAPVSSLIRNVEGGRQRR